MADAISSIGVGSSIHSIAASKHQTSASISSIHQHPSAANIEQQILAAANIISNKYHQQQRSSNKYQQRLAAANIDQQISAATTDSSIQSEKENLCRMVSGVGEL